MASMQTGKMVVLLAMLFAYLLLLPIYLCLEAGSTQPYNSSMSVEITYQRTSTGLIAISDVNPEGKYIMIENISSGINRRDVDLNGWKLERIIDGKRGYTYHFGSVTLKPGKSLKIFAGGSATQVGLNDLVFQDVDSWGVGSQVVTSLLNKNSNATATYIKKTLYN